MSAQMHEPKSARKMSRLVVQVEIVDMKTDAILKEYTTNLANDKQRRIFAEQMTNTYTGGQYSIVSPVEVIA